MNRAEALDREAELLAKGHDVVPVGDDSEMIIVRGCSVTAKSQRDCEKAIDRLREKYPHARIVIEGCLEKRNVPDEPERDALSPAVPMKTSRAYLKVQDGCSGRCAFCIVPHFRGKPVSVPFDVALKKAQAFLSAGFREIVVTGCNLALYRSAGRGLADLLGALAELKCNMPHRVRLGSLEPGICDEAILAAFEKHENICRFIHISLQSASNNVLARMNRPYKIESVDNFCIEARRRFGETLALGADVIAGFPGETEEDFARTVNFFKRLPFSNLHVFPYSERPGTPAATMDGALPRTVRIARAHELEALGKEQRMDFARKFLNRDVEVCIESNNTGWTDEYVSCRVEGENLNRRSIVRAKVTEITDDNLNAVLIE